MILRYSARRDEVWRWYWIRWREIYWKSWLIGCAAVYGLVLLLRGNAHMLHADDFVTALWAPAALCAFFTFYPQAMFKSTERMLEIGPRGIDTEIGDQRGHRDWREIASIAERDGCIALTVARTGNAFLVPDRAFESPEQRDGFLRQANGFLAAARPATSAPPRCSRRRR